MLVFLFSGCTLTNGITERIGGDPAGFATEAFNVRYFASDSDTVAMQIIRDTVIDGADYIQVDTGDRTEFYMYTSEWIYRRMEFRENNIRVPFVNKVLLDGKTDIVTDTFPNYSYTFAMTADSIIELNANGRVYKNVYAVSASIHIDAADADTNIAEQYYLSNIYGILGFTYNDLMYTLAEEQ